MTVPFDGEMIFESETPMSDGARPEADMLTPYPDPIIDLGEDKMQTFKGWLDIWLDTLISEQQAKIQQWADEERSYRAISDGPRSDPYEGACGDVVPAIAMAVDPIQARLSTGIFKSDPVFRLKALKKSFSKSVNGLERWIEYYQKYKLNLRNITGPRLFEFTKHGTMVYKTVYDRDTYGIKSYDREWNVVKKTVTRFSGPRVIGVPITNFLFPARYQTVQDCPIVAERCILTMSDLYRMKASGKVTNIEALIGQENLPANDLEVEQQISSNHVESVEQTKLYLELHEVWCDYDIDGDGIPESLVVTYHKPTQTILQLRYNWYFHQRKPYTVIPYTVAAGSLWGIGIAEMTRPFQEQLTTWHRIATDNAYLANIRMFITKKESGIENRPKLYSGRVFRVDDPRTDFIPFAAADIYNSTLSERQNLFGLAEKRTGISDYLTGRESPVIGSRATATSTLALIQEGTRRVEEVLENIRHGFSEIMQNCISIWIQYGLDGVDDLVFGDDDLTKDLRDFFASVREENVDGALAIDLTATDAANNKTAQQQMQLAIIQVMMGYLEKLVPLSQLALQAQTQQPQLKEMLVEIMNSARNMFRDLLQKYDVRNPDEYLPDLDKYLAETAATGVQPAGGLEGLLGRVVRPAGVQVPSVPVPGVPGSGPPTPGGSFGPSGGLPFAG